MTTSFTRLAIILGLLSMVGPFAIDIYLPALPTIAAALNADIAATQTTLVTFFLAFGVSQLFYGPISDAIGRKKPLYFGLTIFIIGSIGCALSPDITTLSFARFIQGIGAASVMVIPRAIIRDVLTGVAATRLMALVMLVISVSPMFAPIVGSGLMAVFGWQSLFIALALTAIISLSITGFLLDETLAPKACVPVNIKNMIAGSKILFKDPVFMGLTFLGALGMSSFFVFIASASFIFTAQYGLSPVQFSLAFAINGFAFFAATQAAAFLGERFGMDRVIFFASFGFAAATITLFVLTLLGATQLYVLIGMLFVGNACLGLIIPSSMVMALDGHGDIAGLASSIGGTLQMVMGGIMIAAVSPFFDGTSLPMVAAIALCGFGAAILALAMRKISPPTVSDITL